MNTQNTNKTINYYSRNDVKKLTGLSIPKIEYYYKTGLTTAIKINHLICFTYTELLRYKLIAKLKTVVSTYEIRKVFDFLNEIEKEKDITELNILISVTDNEIYYKPTHVNCDYEIKISGNNKGQMKLNLLDIKSELDTEMKENNIVDMFKKKRFLLAV